MLARKYGLTLDRLVGVEMVDAGGAIVTANRTHNADLLWACKGGGGGALLFLIIPTSHPHHIQTIFSSYPDHTPCPVHPTAGRW